MENADLFQLGIGLETGAHEEVTDTGTRADRLLDEDRADHFQRRDGRVFAGTHLIIEVMEADGLDDEDRIAAAFRDCVAASGATLLHIHTHKFSPQGVSGVAVLAESHISVHTWPEARYGAFDVFMCGDANPWAAGRYPEGRVSGGRCAGDRTPPRRGHRRAMTKAPWFVEELHDGYAQSLREDGVLYDSKTDHQRLRVFENAKFGRILTLDNVVQTTTGDEYVYHEMMAHVPILAHGAASRVLIIGGGDGGMAREALRHPGVTHVTMVEIDAGVVEFSKEYLPMLSDGAFDDPRLNLVIADGADFVATTESRFDVIIIDSTDPDRPGRSPLYRHVLRPGEADTGRGRDSRHPERCPVHAGG